MRRHKGYPNHYHKVQAQTVFCHQGPPDCLLQKNQQERLDAEIAEAKKGKKTKK